MKTKRRGDVPWVWAWTHWPVRKRGLVRIAAGIPLHEVHLWGVLAFHREALVRALTPRLTRAEHLDRIAAAIVDSIESAARGYAVRPRPSHLRKAEVRLTARYGVFTLRLKIQRDNFPSWVHLATGDAPRLIRIIREQFFPDTVVDQVIHSRPRGSHPRAPLLLSVARVALLTADELIQEGGPARLAHLQQWLKKTRYETLPNRRDLAAALTERTLEGAWKAYKVTRPSKRAPDQLYADWIPPEKDENLRAARLALESTIKPWNQYPPSEDEVLRAWEKRLTVDPPGQTASDFYLLTDVVTPIPEESIVVTPIPEESIVKPDRTAAGCGRQWQAAGDTPQRGTAKQRADLVR